MYQVHGWNKDTLDRQVPKDFMSLASYPRKLLVNVVYRIEAVIQENIRMDREIQGTGCPLFRDEERPGQGPGQHSWRGIRSDGLETVRRLEG